MITLGIDPGTAITGYGCVFMKGNTFEVLDYGCITTKADWSLGERLQKIFLEINKLINKFTPNCLAIESIFFNRNIRTAISVAQARGVVLLAGTMAHLSVSDYTPPQVKLAVTGYGKADKKQMQQMIKTLLNLDETPKPDDAADALAVAICHLHSNAILI